MTMREIAILMGEIRSFYPVFGNNASDLVEMVKLWHEVIGERISFEEGHAALMQYVQGERAIFPPVPGKLLKIAREIKEGKEAEKRLFDFMSDLEQPSEEPKKTEDEYELVEKEGTMVWKKKSREDD